MNIFKLFKARDVGFRTRSKQMSVDWKNYHPVIEYETENFITTISAHTPTLEGIDTLLHLERMKALGYRFVVEGWSRLIWEKVK